CRAGSRPSGRETGCSGGEKTCLEWSKMPPEINFGQPQKLSHTTESPWEQAALVENSADLRNRARCLLITTGRSSPNFCSLYQAKSRWLTNVLSWPISPLLCINL